MIVSNKGNGKDSRDGVLYGEVTWTRDWQGEKEIGEEKLDA